MTITPSLLEKNAEDLFANIKKLSSYFNSFQVDIADGIDVPNITVQINEISSYLFNNPLLKLKNIFFEFHLMVKDYQTEINKIIKLKNLINIRDILIHIKYLPDISLLNSRYGLPFGLVLYPEDGVDQVINNYRIDDIQYTQIMSCRVGFKGTPFIPESLDKIEQLRTVNYRNIISLDGGINDKSIPLIISKKFKPDILCPNSFLLSGDDLISKVDYLKKLRKKQTN